MFPWEVSRSLQNTKLYWDKPCGVGAAGAAWLLTAWGTSSTSASCYILSRLHSLHMLCSSCLESPYSSFMTRTPTHPSRPSSSISLLLCGGPGLPKLNWPFSLCPHHSCVGSRLVVVSQDHDYLCASLSPLLPGIPRKAENTEMYALGQSQCLGNRRYLIRVYLQGSVCILHEKKKKEFRAARRKKTNTSDIRIQAKCRQTRDSVGTVRKWGRENKSCKWGKCNLFLYSWKHKDPKPSHLVKRFSSASPLESPNPRLSDLEVTKELNVFQSTNTLFLYYWLLLFKCHPVC